MTDPKELNVFAKTNYRNQERRFGIKRDDRRRHLYVIGKTGMGKTTMLENMIVQDIQNGHGVAVVDPHGDLVEKLLDFIPSNRVNDVVYFNPSDIDFPIGFNILETSSETQRHLVASGLMGVFTKIWEGVWSPRMEYILNNSVLALLESPGTTMLGISRLLVDKKYRMKILQNVTDPVVKAFWLDEYAAYNERFRNEAIAPIQNKVGQFLSSAIIRNIVAQPKSSIDLREIMDKKKILLLNLSKGRIGEDSSRLLGAMMITRMQLAAMSRVDIPEEKREDFYLYVDEFQNFATTSFANILSEARKYRLNLILAHQYIEQLDEMVSAAIFGNVGTISCFRVGAADAELLAKEMFPTFTETDLVNLKKFDIYLKLMIDGVASEPFSATTLPPLFTSTPNREKVIQSSRERYAKSKAEVEEKIMRWSGVDEMEKRDEQREAPREYREPRQEQREAPILRREPQVARHDAPREPRPYVPQPKPQQAPLERRESKPEEKPKKTYPAFEEIEPIVIDKPVEEISLSKLLTQQQQIDNRPRFKKPASELPRMSPPYQGQPRPPQRNPEQGQPLKNPQQPAPSPQPQQKMYPGKVIRLPR